MPGYLVQKKRAGQMLPHHQLQQEHLSTRAPWAHLTCTYCPLHCTITGRHAVAQSPGWCCRPFRPSRACSSLGLCLHPFFPPLHSFMFCC